MITGAVGFNPPRRRAKGRGDGGERERSRSPREQCGGGRQRIPDGTQTHSWFPARDFQPLFSTGTAKELWRQICDCLEDLWSSLTPFVCATSAGTELMSQKPILSMRAIVPFRSTAKDAPSAGTSTCPAHFIKHASDLTCVDLGQPDIPQCISTQPETSSAVVPSMFCRSGQHRN